MVNVDIGGIFIGFIGVATGVAIVVGSYPNIYGGLIGCGMAALGLTLIVFCVDTAMVDPMLV